MCAASRAALAWAIGAALAGPALAFQARLPARAAPCAWGRAGASCPAPRPWPAPPVPPRPRRLPLRQQGAGSPRAGSSADAAGGEELEPYELIADAAHEELREWARARGVAWQAWDLAQFPELDVRGAVATAPLVAGEPLVSVPLSAGLTLDASTQCPFPASFAARAAWDDCPRWEFKMALRLLWERSRGRESPFCPFVQAMPPAVDTLRACPAHLLPELQDEALQTRVAEWQHACATEWARVSALLRWRCPRTPRAPRVCVCVCRTALYLKRALAARIGARLALNRYPVVISRRLRCRTLKSAAPSCPNPPPHAPIL